MKSFVWDNFNQSWPCICIFFSLYRAVHDHWLWRRLVTDAVIYKEDHSAFSSFAKVWTEHLVAQWLPPCLSPAVSRGRYLTPPSHTRNTLLLLQLHASTSKWFTLKVDIDTSQPPSSWWMKGGWCSSQEFHFNCVLGMLLIAIKIPTVFVGGIVIPIW